MTDTELRELDAWILTNIVKPFGAVSGFSPTTDATDAMELLEKCVEHGEVEITRPYFHNERKEMYAIRNGGMGDLFVKADTLPLAICKFSKKLWEGK